MARKEEIIYAALELAAENGLSSVSLSQIADRLGMKKPSLYNHFRSKDEMIEAMYSFIRSQAQKAVPAPPEGIFGMPLEQILIASLRTYLSFLSDRNMMMFFKVLYSERSTSPAAAQLILEETGRMVSSTKALFAALAAHNKIQSENAETAAYAYTMAVHSMIDNRMDMVTAGIIDSAEMTALPPEMTDFVKWFCGVCGSADEQNG